MRLSVREMFNIIHNDSVYKIDFIVRKEAEYRKTEFLRRRKVELSDIPMQSVEALDKEYLNSWIEKLNLDLVFEKVGTHE